MSGVLEVARFTVRTGDEEKFEAALGEATALLTRAGGCDARFRRGVEDPSAYLLLVHWHSVEDHLEGFRGSADYQRFRSILTPWYAADPRMEHFSESAVGGLA